MSFTTVGFPPQGAGSAGTSGTLITSDQATQTADFSTTSATEVECTNPAKVTLSGLDAAKTYTVMATSSGQLTVPSGTVRCFLNLKIGSTYCARTGQYGSAQEAQPYALTGSVSGITGVTSVDVILFVHVQSAATLLIDFNSASNEDRQAVITAMAFEE